MSLPTSIPPAYIDATVTFHRADLAERVEAHRVTPGYFELLGILTVFLGRAAA